MMEKEKASLKIKILLMKKGITQREIAKKLGYSYSHLSNIIAGRKKSKKFENWIKNNLEDNL